MLHELWDDPVNEGRYTFCVNGPRGDGARAMLSPGARLVWTANAASHFQAMTRYYAHQGWGIYTTDQEWDFMTYQELGWESEGKPARSVDSQAVTLTRNLRQSDDPLFVVLRDRLERLGVDTDTALLAQLFPDDTDQEFGVIVTPERGVFTFVLHHGRRGDLKTQIATATIPSLNDISDDWQTSPYRRYVNEAMRLSEGWDR